MNPPFTEEQIVRVWYANIEKGTCTEHDGYARPSQGEGYFFVPKVGFVTLDVHIFIDKTKAYGVLLAKLYALRASVMARIAKAEDEIRTNGLPPMTGAQQ